MPFEKEWLREPEFQHWLVKRDKRAYCRACKKQIVTKYASDWALKAHAKTKKHRRNMRRHQSHLKSNDDDTTKDPETDSTTDPAEPNDDTTKDSETDLPTDPTEPSTSQSGEQSLKSKTDKISANSSSPTVSELENPQSQKSDDSNESVDFNDGNWTWSDLDNAENGSEEESESESESSTDDESRTSPAKKAKMDTSFNATDFRFPRECQNVPKEGIEMLKQTASCLSALGADEEITDSFFKEILSTVQSWPLKMQSRAKRGICNVVFDLALQSLNESY